MKKEQGFISPLNDYVVKCIYGDQKNIANTEGFLKTVLDIPPEDYGRLRVIDPFLKRRWKKDKQGVVDIHLAMAGRRRVAIDVQVQRYSAMRSRIQYYNSKMVMDQMKSGFDYGAIGQTISVVITDYTLLYDEDDYLNIYEPRNRKSGKLFSDLQQYVILELPKLPDEDDGQPVWPFLKFFKCRKQEEFEMLRKRHPELEPQVEEYQRISWSQRRRLLADYWEKQRRDAASAMNYAREEGRLESQQALAAKDRVITENRQKLDEKNRENEALRRKLREAGIDD
ncbi:MAG: Rpn family recombination-promoting nuclease/putative transposase [Treponema sp.]|jgi:predicted transposase/invertase (TIGR01784 family)|nr:Rpn family recombination-promoting nuclease/putative transposase [Treponema sp.]